jgi:hypothetical protein
MLTITGSLDSVSVVSALNLAGTYSGTGVGATLTATTNSALIIDTFVLTVGNRVLLVSQSTPSQNGIYVVTNAGSSTNPWVLTRSTDFDGSTTITAGLYVFVTNGNTYSNTGWILTGSGSGTVWPGALVIGTDPVTFVEASAVAFQFQPTTLVYVVNASTFGIAKATVQSVSITSSTPNVVTTTYSVQYLNTARTANSVDSSMVFANADAALAAYQPLIT